MSDGLASYSQTSTTYDELVAGETITTSGVILTGQGALIRGTIMGKDAATGKWARATALTPGGILVHDVDTTAGDVTGIVHVQGKFKDNVVVLPPAMTMADARKALWDSGVYLLDVQE
jgi:Bacteriophage lambda head decoration protein D